MSEASFASLGPTLLARKGGAKPAMRPQLAPLTQNLAEIAALADEQLEDLGWNDMGCAEETVAAKTDSALIIDPAQDDCGDADNQATTDSVSGAQIVSIESRKGRPIGAPEPANEDAPTFGQQVIQRQKNKSANAMMSGATMKSPQIDAKPQSAKTKAKGNSASKRRAAFTLRLDAQRHLKLRLASTMLNKSSQALVTEALDAAFAKIEDLDALASRMKRD